MVNNNVCKTQTSLDSSSDAFSKCYHVNEIHLRSWIGNIPNRLVSWLQYVTSYSYPFQNNTTPQYNTWTKTAVLQSDPHPWLLILDYNRTKRGKEGKEGGSGGSTFDIDGIKSSSMYKGMMLMHPLKISTQIPIQRIFLWQLKFPTQTNIQITFHNIPLQGHSIEILQTP